MKTAVSFDADRIRRWLEFSGDTNPIHSDMELVKSRFGLPDLAVPGMQAMLACKTALSGLAGGPGWWRFTAMLRRMILCGQACELSVPDGPSTTGNNRYTLAGPEGVCINGGLNPAPEAAAELGQLERFSLGGDRLARFMEDFRDGFPEVTRLWVALDAILFAIYLRDHSRQVHQTLIERGRLSAGNDLAELARRFTVLQTFHATSVSGSLLAREVGDVAVSMEYAVKSVDVVQSRDGFFAVVTMPLWLEGSLALVMEVGITVKLA